ncbi:MAG TPA: hypothetical protein VH229_03190 [Candidatus Udaeobacter sp.]|nr:hypothetical protein [Candidatus Udaeobacter sp.]
MRSEFDELTSSCEKNRSSSEADDQRKFMADRIPKMACVFRLGSRLCLERHAGEHIELTRFVQFAKVA